MSLEALIFDLDGTMADTEEAHREAFNAAFSQFQLQWNWGPLLYSELLEISGGVDRLHHYIETLDQPPAEKERLHELVPAVHRAKSRIYSDVLNQGAVPLRPGVKRLIREAQSEDLKVAVVSTTASANARALLDAHSGRPDFRRVDLVLSVDVVRRRKPAPDIYERALALLGKPAEVCVAFEDSANGLRAARSAGLTTVVTPTIWTVAQDFTGTDLLLRGLGDPEFSLPYSDEQAVGASQLGLAQLRRMHEAALRRRAVAEAGRP